MKKDRLWGILPLPMETLLTQQRGYKMQTVDKKFNIQTTTEEGWFSGYASIYDALDLHKDIVAKGAFYDTLQEEDQWPKMLWQHDPAFPIGKWEKIEEREEGLYVEGRLFLKLPKAQEAFLLLKEGEVKGLSIGFQVEKSRRLTQGRLLEKLKLYEISLVTFPANPKARVLTAKQFEDYALLLEKIDSLRQEMNP